MFDVKKNYGILGLARSGIAAAYKILSLGGNAFLSDMKLEADVPEADNLKRDFHCEFGKHSKKLLDCDEWIVSPGIPLNSPIITMGKKHNIKMISELELGFQVKHPDSKLIAVTGSNGKSTTSSMIAHIVNNSGRKCILAGNIGDAFCGFPIEQPGIDFIVLEVSSFQLDLIDTFRPDIALLLNITPDHLNRYDSFDDYALSKFNIFKNQTPDNHAIINLDDPIIIKNESLIKARKHYFSMQNFSLSESLSDIWHSNGSIFFGENNNLLEVKSMRIKGPHNIQNAMASVLAGHFAGLSDSALAKGVLSYNALKHRLQYIRTITGVDFYNDSKATNTDSVRVALLSFDKPIRLIMGGSDKGEDYGVLTELLKQKAKKVYVTGATSAQMMQTWYGKIPITAVDDFEVCVRSAYLDSVPGDIIVLSPACASYDKFRNFEHRGDTYIQIVQQLAGENEEKQS